MVEGFGGRLRQALFGRRRTTSVREQVVAPPRKVADQGSPPRRNGRDGVPPPLGMRTYPGDYVGIPAMAWDPKPDGHPDPGEVVWTWVPFEEDSSVGKDRPVLLVGHDGDWLLGVMLTSKDHDRELAREHAEGRDWVDVGAGAWDAKGRPSEVRADRLIRIDPGSVRRQGAVLDEGRFQAVAEAIRAAG
ncbi:MAG: type II toxin-antitoxin system PemK/MazF family toxin [Lapillicoccus sp.]